MFMAVFPALGQKNGETETDMKAIVGLGNPGSKYTHTRHNLGFMVVDELTSSLPATAARKRFRAHIIESRIQDRKLILAKPLTFMNLIGVAFRQRANWYRLEDEDLLIVVDDVNLPFGKLRIRERGSAGGHNGLTSIFNELGTNNIARLRVGIGQGPHEARSHVLSHFSADERTRLGDILERSADAATIWATEGTTAAMNSANSSVASNENQSGASETSTPGSQSQ